MLPKVRAVKHKQALSASLLRLFEEFGGSPFNMGQCLPVLVKFLGEADDKIRKAARTIAVHLHGASGPAILSLLENKGVKSSTIQEITKEAASGSLPPPPRTVKGAVAAQPTGGAAGGAAGSAAVENMIFEESVPEPVLKHLPKDFISVITDPKAKWSAKKEMMDSHFFPHASKVRLQQDDYGELAKGLKRALSDSNLAMVGLACKGLLLLCKGLRTHFARESRLLFPHLLDLLKEKKTVVADPLRDMLFVMYDFGIVQINEIAEDVLKSSADKVLLVRLGVLQWMERCVTSSSAERAQRACKLFSTVAVKILETDPDSGVKEAASKLCVSLYKVLGESQCGFINGVNAKARDKILKAAAGGGTSAVTSTVNSMPGGALRRSASTRAPPGKSLGASTSSGPGDDDAKPAPRALSRTMKAPRTGGLSSSVSGRPKESAGDKGASASSEALPPPFSRSDAEGMLESAAPSSAEKVTKGLASKVFKERLEAASLAGESLAGMEGSEAAELVASLFHSATPGWKDPTFQVVLEMTKVVLACLNRATGPVRLRVIRATSPAVEKLQDMKVKGVIRELLTRLCEGTSPRPVVAEVVATLSATKSPKAIQEGLDWVSEVLLEFGSGTTDEKGVLSFALKCLDTGASSGAQTPAMKTAALKAIGALARCCGADSVLRLARDSQLRPALLKQVEDECEKSRQAGSVVPKKAAQQNPAGRAGGGGGGGLDEPRDIRPLIDAGLLGRLSQSNWSDRGEALEELHKIVSQKLKPEIGPDLIPALKQRLADTNRNLVPQACNVVASLFQGLGGACRNHCCRLIPVILALLGDQKPPVRAGARKVLTTFDGICGLEGLLPYLPKAMSTDVPIARQELSEFLVDVFDRDAGKLAPASLQPVVQPLVSLVQDKHPTTRKHAEELLKPVVESVGYDLLAKHVGDLNAANQRALQPILEKNKQFSREQQKPAKRPRLPGPKPVDADVEMAPAADDASMMQVDDLTTYRPKLGFKAMTRDASLNQMQPDLPMETPMMPRQQQHVEITSLSQAVDLLASANMSTCLMAAEFIQQEHRQGASVPIDNIMLKAMGRLTTICTDDNVPLDVKGSKELVSFMTNIFQPPLSLRCKTDTLYYLIGSLLDNLLTDKLHQSYRTQSGGVRQNSDDILRSLNSLMLKLLERSGRTETFTALLRRLDRYNNLIYAESSRYIKFVELVAKCLLKLIRFIANENGSRVDFTELLDAVHKFLNKNPPTNFKGRMELPLRTVKTLLNELVKIRGESIRLCLDELNISSTSLIAEFITMCLNKSQDETGTAPNATFTRLPSVGAVGPPAVHKDPTAGMHAAPPGPPAGGRAGMQTELCAKMDEIFLRVRKTDTSREGVKELYLLMQSNPTLDITPWLSECSAPFQGFLQRQLAALASADRPEASSLASSASSMNSANLSGSGSLPSLRERMERVRASRQQPQ
eukprot:TRINITY_DN25445_c0_g2_i1.p1 TRINITY_DN25445_c0_g2~~TRINITY_DN25445_c0_g2_i1.p1  ORF type:complete len:1568 (+),score=623.16 TRINITY_DN25445_c0_g2_i1:361-4704(+)